MIHLLQAIRRIARCARAEEQRDALRQQVRSITKDVGRAIADSVDLEDISAHAKRVLEMLGGLEAPRLTASLDPCGNHGRWQWFRACWGR